MEVSFFYCYNNKLKKHLLQNGLRYVIRGVNPKSQKQFWQFIQTPELTEYIESYKNRNV